MRGAWMVGVAALALALGLGVGLWKITPGKSELSPAQIYATHFEDLAGQAQAMGNWRGKVMVINFWATWCPPCREEIPDFIKVSNAYSAQGVSFIGIALDERDLVVAFAKEYKVTYPMLLGGNTGHEFAERLGNTSNGIPFTVILNRQGEVVYVAVGVMHRAELEKQAA